MIQIIIIALQLTFTAYSPPCIIADPNWITPVHEFEPLELTTPPEQPESPEGNLSVGGQ